MQTITDRSTIREMRLRKKNVELSLGKALHKCFESDDLIYPLRHLVFRLMIKIQQLMRSDLFFALRIREVFLKEQALMVWTKSNTNHKFKTEQRFDEVIRKIDQWTPSDCSDLIRLYGEVVEKLGGVKQLEATERALGLFWKGQLTRADHDYGSSFYESMLRSLCLRRRVVAEWREYDEEKHRYRDFPSFRKDPVRGDEGRLIEEAERSRAYAGREIRTDESGVLPQVHPLVPKMPGVCRWRLTEQDTTKSIDNMFGLYEGASVSGTTSDTVYCLDYVGRRNAAHFNFPKALRLLPFATMVWNYHHTLLEIALALKLALTLANETQDYSVDFYASLMPAGEQAGGLMATLQQYQTLADELHLIIVSKRTGNGGIEERAYRMTEPAEKNAFKTFAGLDNLASFRKLKHLRHTPILYKQALVGELHKARLYHVAKSVWSYL